MNNSQLYDSSSGKGESVSLSIFPIVTINFNLLKGNATEGWSI
ncbi:MAG: hypothetical protein ACLTBX_07960 [Clostridia bacterium]